MSDKIRSGFRVFGHTSTGEFHGWYFPTLEEANSFAKLMAADLGFEYDVLKYVGTWKRTAAPTEFIKPDKP